MKEKYKIGLILIFTFVIWGIFVPRNIQAASFQKIYTLEGWKAEERTVGGCTFLTKNGILTAAKGGKTYTIAKAGANGEKKPGYEVVSNGKVVYYYVSSVNYRSAYYVYRANIDGTGKTKLFSYKGKRLELYGIYGSKLYYVTGHTTGSFRSCNVKTKKRERIAANVTTADQYGRFFYLRPYSGALSGTVKLQVYDARTGRLTMLSKCLDDYSIVSGKLYYSEYVKCDYRNENHVLRIRCCDLNGKRQKTLVPSLKARYIIKYGRTGVRYGTYSNKVRTVKY